MIAVVATGGTIAQSPSPGRSHVPPSALLWGSAQGPVPIDDVEWIDLFDLPSSHVRPREMLRLCSRIEALATRQDVEGIVVTHGTATLEESAYLADLLYRHAKPVVFTGSIRTPGTVGYDGARNLVDSLHVARSKGALDLGVLVVLNGEIHAARDVAKVDASSICAFESPGLGPLGRVAGPYVNVARRIARHGHKLRASSDTDLPRVELMTVYSGLCADVIAGILSVRPSGLVLAAMGGGAVPPDVVGALRGAIAAGVTVVMGTRCIRGNVFDPGPDDHIIEGYGRHLVDMGLHLTALQPLKARIKLMLYLANKVPIGRWL